MKKFIPLFVLGSLMITASVKGQTITTSTPNPNPAYLCDNITFAIAGTHGCLGSTLTTTTHSVSGSTITITVGASIPQICQGVITIFTTNYTLTGINPGTYSVVTKYGANITGASSSLTIINSPIADAGSDTSLCNASSFAMRAVAAPSPTTGSWSLVSGSGTITNPTMHNTSITNLGFGTNVFEWELVDSACTTTDEITIKNYAMPSVASTESDRIICSNVDTVNATAPAVGVGEWVALTSGPIVVDKNNATSRVWNLSKGQNVFAWTVSNGVCPESANSLILDFKTVTDTPMISIASSQLMSTTAVGYQWYVDQVKIPNETNQSITPMTNGDYQVMATYPNCDNGILSNEINVTWAGIDQAEEQKFNIFPNPTSGQLTLQNVELGSNISVYNYAGAKMFYAQVSTSPMNLNLESLSKGMYTIVIRTNEDVHTENIVISE